MSEDSKKEEIREAQQEVLRQTIRLAANLTRNSTLIVLDYILNTSTTASAEQIANDTGLSIRSVTRHLRRLRKHPRTRCMFTQVRPRTRVYTPVYNNKYYYNYNNNNLNKNSNNNNKNYNKGLELE